MKYLYLISGFVSLFFGIIAALAPVLPAFLFIIFAAFCFARGSERFHDWLVTHKWFGPMIDQYNQKGVTWPIRIMMAAFITLWSGISLYFINHLVLQITIIAVWGALTLGLLTIRKRRRPMTEEN